MNFQEIREKSWSGGNGSALRPVRDASPAQFQMTTDFRQPKYLTVNNY